MSHFFRDSDAEKKLLRDVRFFFFLVYLLQNTGKAYCETEKRVSEATDRSIRLEIMKLRVLVSSLLANYALP